MSQPLLALRGIAGARGGRTLFAGIDLELSPGDAAVVTGPNGAGKSTLLRIAAGLLTPAAGTVDAWTPIALLGERSALDPDLSLTDALAFWARLDGAADPGARVAAALEWIGLAPLARVPVRLLSTGQRRRAGLARILASPAPIWLLDEPANGLDTTAVTRLAGLIDDHRANGGSAVIATHLPIAIADAAELRLCGGEVAA